MQKNPLKSLDPNTALSDAIVTAFSIREYVEIINAVKNLGFEHEWRSFSGKAIGERIEKAELIYSEMEQWYQVFLESSKGKRCIKKFDAVLPEYKDILSNTKKVDFLLVFKR